MKSQGDRAGARMGMGGSDSNIIYFILALRISREVLDLYMVRYLCQYWMVAGSGVPASSCTRNRVDAKQTSALKRKPESHIKEALLRLPYRSGGPVGLV